MPTTYTAQHGQPLPVKVVPPEFVFPANNHLVITTEKHVLSWDAHGLRKIFNSGSRGILAAKEAKDGSGMLAVADSQVVVLHNIKAGIERSYRLKGTDGQIRLLEYADDSKSLFFTTTLTNSVQSYSLRESRLLDPAYSHPSPPVVLALSPTSHLLLTASENPPTTYLQNLTLRTPPLLLQPSASAGAAVTAAFHPERPDVFLIGFKDGTLAAYDATRLLRDNGRMPPVPITSRQGQSGEIAHLKSLHAVTSRGSKDPNGLLDAAAAALGGYDEGTKTVSVGARSVGITGAAFMPGHKTRAVSVGADGRCRIVDFDLGGKVLRTWHVKGPATVLSVLPMLPVQRETTSARSSREATIPAKRKPLRSGNSIPEAGTKNNIIAVGRLDGKVLLFDSLGLLLMEESVDSDAGRVIDVEWMHGPGLKAETGSNRVQLESDTVIDLIFQSESQREGASAKFKVMKGGSERATGPGKLLASFSPVDGPSERASPDVNDGTVSHRIIDGPIHRDLPAVSTSAYMDLFSPVRRLPMGPSPKRTNTGLRTRPRISSSTFKDNTKGTSRCLPSPLRSLPRRARTIPIKPTSPTPRKRSPLPTNAGSLPARDRGLLTLKPLHLPSPEKLVSKPPLRSPHRARPARKSFGRRVSVLHMPGAFVESKTSLVSNVSDSSSSGKILADLRRVSSAGAKGRRKGDLAILAPYTGKRDPTRAQEGSDMAVKGSDSFDSTIRKADTDLDGIELGQENLWLTSSSDSEIEQSKAGACVPRRLESKRSPGITPSCPLPDRQLMSSTSETSLTDNSLSMGGRSVYDTACSKHQPLAPGSAQSPKGPVEVRRWFPRGSSLAGLEAPGSSRGCRGKEGKAMRELPINEAHQLSSRRRVSGWEGEMCVCGCVCCTATRHEMVQIKRELEELKREMRRLREVVRL